MKNITSYQRHKLFQELTTILTPTAWANFGGRAMDTFCILNGLPIPKNTNQSALYPKSIATFISTMPSLLKQLLGIAEYYHEHKDLFRNMTAESIPREFINFILGVHVIADKVLTYTFKCGYPTTLSHPNKHTVYLSLKLLVGEFTGKEYINVNNKPRVLSIHNIVDRYLEPFVVNDTTFLPDSYKYTFVQHAGGHGIYLTVEDGLDHVQEPRLFPKLEYVRAHVMHLTAQHVNVKLPKDFYNDYLMVGFDRLHRVVIDLVSKINQVVVSDTKLSESGVDISDADRLLKVFDDIKLYHQTE